MPSWDLSGQVDLAADNRFIIQELDTLEVLNERGISVVDGNSGDATANKEKGLVL